jgi:hypothetical protein
MARSLILWPGVALLDATKLRGLSQIWHAPLHHLEVPALRALGSYALLGDELVVDGVGRSAFLADNSHSKSPREIDTPNKTDDVRKTNP